MKKIIWLVISLFIITGCGNSELNEFDIKKAQIAVEETLKNMTDIDEDTLKNVYNLDFNFIKEYVMKENENGELYAIIYASDKAIVKKEMDSYFLKLRDFSVAYSPERVELLDNHLEKEIGDYLIYIVAEDNTKVYNDIINTME